jgi:hypothetical protein
MREVLLHIIRWWRSLKFNHLCGWGSPLRGLGGRGRPFQLTLKVIRTSNRKYGSHFSSRTPLDPLEPSLSYGSRRKWKSTQFMFNQTCGWGSPYSPSAVALLLRLKLRRHTDGEGPRGLGGWDWTISKHIQDNL